MILSSILSYFFFRDASLTNVLFLIGATVILSSSVLYSGIFKENELSLSPSKARMEAQRDDEKRIRDAAVWNTPTLSYQLQKSTVLHLLGNCCFRPGTSCCILGRYSFLCLLLRLFCYCFLFISLLRNFVFLVGSWVIITVYASTTYNVVRDNTGLSI